MLYPSLETVVQIKETGDYRRVPVREEMFMDMLTPIQAVRILKRVSRHCFLLESAEQSQKWGRYTFLGYDPGLDITCLDGVVKVSSATEFETDRQSPREVIRHILAENRAPRLKEMPPFSGGLVGYFAYDYIKYSLSLIHI